MRIRSTTDSPKENDGVTDRPDNVLKQSGKQGIRGLQGADKLAKTMSPPFQSVNFFHGRNANDPGGVQVGNEIGHFTAFKLRPGDALLLHDARH